MAIQINKLKKSLTNIAEEAAVRAKDIKIPEVDVEELKKAGQKVTNQITDTFKKKEEIPEEVHFTPNTINTITTEGAIKVFYLMMLADGQLQPAEEERFDSIGLELDPNFISNKDRIIAECKSEMESVFEPESYYDIISGAVDSILTSSIEDNAPISPKLLIWNLFSVAYSDGNCDPSEKNLIRTIAKKLKVDKAICLEMESSLQTLIDIEKEITYIKTTDRPYRTIEAMVNELADRKNVITESIKALVTL